MSDYTELRAALAAGPTAGPWVACGPSFGDPLPRWLDSVVQPDDEDGGETVARSEYGAQEQGTATIVYIAAADPQTIAALLAALDDARRDADRWRHLKADSILGIEQNGCGWSLHMPSGIAPDSKLDIDAAIDTCIERAAMKGKP